MEAAFANWNAGLIYPNELCKFQWELVDAICPSQKCCRLQWVLPGRGRYVYRLLLGIKLLVADIYLSKV